MEDCKLGRACFVDVETTGLSPKSEEIIELSVCLFEFDHSSGEIIRIVDRYTGLREPGVPVSAGAARVHGLSLQQLRGKTLDHPRVEAMMRAADFMVAHNARFDRGFVMKLFPLTRKKTWLCSMSGVDWYKKGFASRGLQNLLREHGICTERAHRAEDDVMATLTLLGRRDKDGNMYFAELLRCLPAATGGTGSEANEAG